MGGGGETEIDMGGLERERERGRERGREADRERERETETDTERKGKGYNSHVGRTIMSLFSTFSNLLGYDHC